MMFGHYGRCYDLEPVLRESRATAEAMGFEHCVYDASYDFLTELLSGEPFDEKRFIVFRPGDIIAQRDLWID